MSWKTRLLTTTPMRLQHRSRSRPEEPSQPQLHLFRLFWPLLRPTHTHPYLDISANILFSSVKTHSALPLLSSFGLMSSNSPPTQHRLFPVQEISCITHIYMLSTKPLICPLRNMEPLWLTSAHNPVSARVCTFIIFIFRSFSPSSHSSDFDESAITRWF